MLANEMAEICSAAVRARDERLLKLLQKRGIAGLRAMQRCGELPASLYRSWNDDKEDDDDMEERMKDEDDDDMEERMKMSRDGDEMDDEDEDETDEVIEINGVKYAPVTEEEEEDEEDMDEVDVDEKRRP